MKTELTVQHRSPFLRVISLHQCALKSRELSLGKRRFTTVHVAVALRLASKARAGHFRTQGPQLMVIQPLLSGSPRYLRHDGSRWRCVPLGDSVNRSSDPRSPFPLGVYFFLRTEDLTKCHGHTYPPIHYYCCCCCCIKHLYITSVVSLFLIIVMGLLLRLLYELRT